MKLTVRFDAFDLSEVLLEAAVESMPLDAEGHFLDEMAAARQDRFREMLAPWIDDSGQDSGHDRIVVEFDLGVEPPTARVLGGVGPQSGAVIEVPSFATPEEEMEATLRGSAVVRRLRGGAA